MDKGLSVYKRLVLVTVLLAASILTALAHVLISRATGFYIDRLTLYLFPLGAAIVGFIGTSGAIPLARYLDEVWTTKLDAVIFTVFGGVTMFFIFYLDYLIAVLTTEGRAASGFGAFLAESNSHHVIWELAQSSLKRSVRTSVDIGPIGPAIESVGFLVGGFAKFFCIGAFLNRCKRCGGIVEWVDHKESPEMPMAQARAFIEAARAGRTAAYRELLSLRPVGVEPGDRARIGQSLRECHRCREQVIELQVQAFDGKDWKRAPDLADKRVVAPGTIDRSLLEKHVEPAPPA